MTRQISSLFLLLFFTTKSYGQKDSCIFNQTFFSNGHVHEEGCVIKGKREGLWNDYNEHNGKVRFIWTYKNNLKDGPYKALGETGIIEATGKYFKGSLADTVKSYNDNGQLTDYSVWKVMGDGGSEMIFQKTLIKPEKPDGTTETINGKRYLWDSGRKYEIKEK